MPKAMLFIDGTWLYANVPRLSELYGKDDFRVDFGKLPKILAEEVSEQLGGTELDVVRAYLFGSYAANYDKRDDAIVHRRRSFFDMLKEEYHYELELFPINFRGRQVRRVDRDPKDTFEPQEKCVDIAVASSLLYYAAIPNAYDIAIVVAGDRDFKPALQCARRLGKRVAIASIQGSCTPEYSDPRDEARVKDFDIIWLDHLLDKLELKYERHQLECQSPWHEGDRIVWTTFYPRKSQKFYCPECQDEFTRQKAEAQKEYNIATVEYIEDPPLEDGATKHSLFGKIVKRVPERGFGFINAEDGQDYFFHFTDLIPPMDFDDALEGVEVEFEIKREPGGDQAAAAQAVRPAPVYNDHV